MLNHNNITKIIFCVKQYCIYFSSTLFTMFSRQFLSLSFFLFFFFSLFFSVSFYSCSSRKEVSSFLCSPFVVSQFASFFLHAACFCTVDAPQTWPIKKRTWKNMEQYPELQIMDRIKFKFRANQFKTKLFIHLVQTSLHPFLLLLLLYVILEVQRMHWNQLIIMKLRLISMETLRLPVLPAAETVTGNNSFYFSSKVFSLRNVYY